MTGLNGARYMRVPTFLLHATEYMRMRSGPRAGMVVLIELSASEHSPVNPLEEWMVLDVVGPVLQCPISLAQVHLQQITDEVPRGPREVRGEVKLAVNNILVLLNRISRIERGVSSDQLEKQHSKGPPVCCLAMAFVEDDLRSQIVRRACER